MNDIHYPYFGVPPARQPRPAADEPALRGKRVILSTSNGFVYDMRAVSAMYADSVDSVVDIVTEEDYYRWMFLKVPPRTTSYPTHLVWVE